LAKYWQDFKLISVIRINKSIGIVNFTEKGKFMKCFFLHKCFGILGYSQDQHLFLLCGTFFGIVPVADVEAGRCLDPEGNGVYPGGGMGEGPALGSKISS
jgi:hypothetical protein